MCRKRRALKLRYLTNKPQFVHLCYHATVSKYLDYFIIAVIIANTATLSVDYYGIPPSVQNGLAIANIVFSTLFGAEMALKLIGT